MQLRRQRRFLDTSGFTLVEVLVAFTVMATLLSVLFRGVVTLRTGSLAYDEHSKQQIIARSILAEVLARRQREPGRRSGIRNGHRWTLIAKPIDLSGQMPPPEKGPDASSPANGKPQTAADSKPRWTPQKLILRIETKGRPVVVETIRLVEPEQGP